jgi:hypothetical protein
MNNDPMRPCIIISGFERAIFVAGFHGESQGALLDEGHVDFLPTGYAEGGAAEIGVWNFGGDLGVEEDLGAAEVCFEIPAVEGC